MPRRVLLWPQGAPDSGGWDWPEREFRTPPTALHQFRQVRNVTQPTLTPFLPEQPNGTAVIVCPGGALHTLAHEHEGEDVAHWLKERGISAFVLKYRLVRTSDRDDEFELRMQELMIQPQVLRDLTRQHAAFVLADGQQAVRTVRQQAKQYGVNPERIGIMGFSAGGFVAASVAMQHDPASRPDFAAIIYGAMWEAVTVPPHAPVLFQAWANDDELGEIVTTPNQALAQAWQQAGIPNEQHAYARGGHGFGMIRQGLPSDGWIDRFHDWLSVL